MKIGRNMRAIIWALEAHGHEHGRPPSRQELRAATGITPQAATVALQRLADAGHVCGVGGGHYVLVRTLDGRPVTYTQTIGPAWEVGS